jgi:hypothetical protein
MGNANEPSAEPTGVNRLDPWMRRHPQYVAGIWAFFALTSAVTAVLASGDEPLSVIRLALTLCWTLLALREVRRYRAQRSRNGA